jgi:dTDP-glucose pyrophosphorylase
MTDIVERLRRAGLRDGFAVILHQHVIQAADEIERLRAGLRMLVTQEYDAGWSPEGYADAVLSGHEP